MPETVHIGCGAGFMGDRFDASLPILASMERRAGPRYLMFEVLAERTLAVAQNVRREDPSKGLFALSRALHPPGAGRGQGGWA